MDRYILNRKDSLVLVVDIQDRLKPAMYNGERVVKNTKIILESAKILNIPVLFTEQYPKGLGKTLPEIIGIQENPEVFEKNSFSGCTDLLNDKLKELGKKKIIVVGMEAHVCVFQTCRDLLLNGYDVHVVKDAVASRERLNYRNALGNMREMGAVINNTETILFDLLKKAGTDEFKVISKMIK